MRPVEKFLSDLDQATRRGGPQALAQVRGLFERSFPAVRGETAAALLADLAEKWRADPAAAASWLGTVASIVLLEYDGAPLSSEDWAGLREAFSAGSGELDLELLTYAMDLVLEHGAL